MGQRNTTSPRFVCQINGQHRCIGGFDGFAVLSAGFSYTHLDQSPPPRVPCFVDAAVDLHLGGLQDDEHFNWLKEDLFVGDHVSVRFIEGGPIDQPIDRHPKDHYLHPQCPALGIHEPDFRMQMEEKKRRFEQVGRVMPQRMSVALNGKQLCIAGVESGVLSVMLTWVRRDPTTRPKKARESEAEWEGGETDLHVGGLEGNKHRTWIQKSIEIGDEITVCVLGTGPFDPPRPKRRY